MNRTVDSVIKQYINKYHNPDATRRDVMMALNMYQSLVPKQEQYVFNDGSTIDLLNLDGTIPVTYKGTVYHIPVCIWLMDTHPNNAPICYIKPTSDMKIRVSMFVDHNGKIYLPYLHDWVPHSSDLLGLIQVMIVTFGDMPPVYSVKSTVDLAYPKSTYMPQPGTGTNQSYLPYPPTFNQPATSYGSGYPPYPPTSTPSYPPYPTYNYSTPYPPAMPPAIPSYENQFPSDTSEGSRPTGNSFENPYAWSPPAGPRATGTITEEHIRASLLSAVEDKLRRRMKEQLSQAQAELDTLRRTNQELSQGKSRLDDIFIRLDKEKAELDKNITILQDKEKELLEGLERLTDEDDIDVDEAVTTTAPIYKQLLIAFAEEAATEDAIYYMGEALRRGAIDLDVFLKQVRALSRKQFMLRALMQKCRQKAGLAG